MRPPRFLAAFVAAVTVAGCSGHAVATNAPVPGSSAAVPGSSFALPGSSSVPTGPASPLPGVPLPLPGSTAPGCGGYPTKSGYIRAENDHPGGTGWRYAARRDTGLQAYADTTSAVCGQAVHLMVSSSAPSATVTAWRMGYYGGRGGRAVATSGTFRTRRQPAAVVDRATRSPRAPWTATVSVPIDARFTPGSYLLKLTDSRGGQAYVPLTVTDPASQTPLVLMSEPMTWSAYNNWGGASAYRGARGYRDRSLVSSLDRPFDREHGMATYLSDEYSLVRLVEQHGLDVDYVTDVDLGLHPEWLRQHRGVLLGAHAEYWSAAMRDGFDAARDAGVNIALFGANTGYWQVRPMPSPVGANRAFAIYRQAPLDPVAVGEPQAGTVRFRDLPSRRPEKDLFGQQYESCPGHFAAMVLSAPGWPFPAGTPAGTVLPVGVRQEFDQARTPIGPNGAQLNVLATSPLPCNGGITHANVTYYTAASGAGVFSAGTMGWVCQLWGAATCAYGGPTAGVTGSMLNATTLRLVTAMSAGPLGTSHPSIEVGAPNSSPTR